MNFKTTLLLIVLLAVVGIFLVIDRFVGGEKKDATPTASVEEGRPLFDFKPQDVTRFVITPAEGQKIVLQKKEEGKWRLSEPVDAPAETWSADALVRDIVELKSRGRIEADSATGLQQPRYRIELTAGEGKVHTLAIGEVTAVGDVMYVRTGDSKKADVVAAAELHEKLSKPADDLRDKQLVAISSTDIRQVAIERAEGNLKLRKVNNEWEITEPKAMPAEESAVSDMLFAITGLRAAEYVANDSPQLKLAQLDQPQMSVWFSTEAPATQPATAPATQDTGTTIRFGRHEDIRRERLFASVSTSSDVVKVSASSLKSFEKKPLELRSKKVVQIKPEEVSRISIETDLPATTQPTTREASRSHVVLVRRKESAVLGPTMPATAPATQPTTAEAANQPAEPLSKWQVEADDATKVDDMRVTTLLGHLNPLRAEKFLEDHAADKPADQYTLKITTEGPGGTPVTHYEFRFTEVDGTQPVIGRYNDLVFEVNRSVLTDLKAKFIVDPPAPEPVSADAEASP